MTTRRRKREGSILLLLLLSLLLVQLMPGLKVQASAGYHLHVPSSVRKLNVSASLSVIEPLKQSTSTMLGASLSVAKG